MGFEPTTLRDLVGCSNHWATGDSMVSTGEMWVLTRTASRSHINFTCMWKWKLIFILLGLMQLHIWSTQRFISDVLIASEIRI